jgi:hypothetical protein
LSPPKNSYFSLYCIFLKILIDSTHNESAILLKYMGN